MSAHPCVRELKDSADCSVTARAFPTRREKSRRRTQGLCDDASRARPSKVDSGPPRELGLDELVQCPFDLVP